MKLLWLLVALVGVGRGQQALGTVAAADATLSDGARGVVAVSGGRAALVAGSGLVAKERTAEVALVRGGVVRVCQTSGLHVAGSNAALLLALDRGAMEIHMRAAAEDVVMTPDLRFTLLSAGELDLRIRVTRNGDTCVENRGRKAPALRLEDAFGAASYEVKAGQHVLFEHGNLREVVDRETTPCGCPPDEVSRGSIAEAALAHPFPEAVSEGLAAPPAPPAEAGGQTHVQVTTALTFDAAEASARAAQVAVVAAVVPARAAVVGPARRRPFAAVGRFFRRLFVR